MVYAGSLWGHLVILAQMGSPRLVGIFGLGLAIATPIVQFLNLQLRQLQATDSRHQYPFPEYLGLRLVTSAASIIVGFAVALGFGLSPSTALVVMMVCVAKAIESLSDVFYGLFQQHERMNHIATSMLMRGPLSLIGLGLGVYATGELLWGVVALALAWGGVLVAYDVPVGVWMQREAARRGEGGAPGALRPRFDRSALLKLARLALPLGVSMGLLTFNTQMPRYFVQTHEGESELGIFVALAQLAIVGGLVVYSLGGAMLPRFSQYHARDDRRGFRRLMVVLLLVNAAIGMLGIGVAVLAGPQLLDLFYGAEYALHGETLVWLMVGGGISFVATGVGSASTTTRRLRWQPVAHATVSVGSLAACAWLVPAHGIVGAGMATVVSALLALVTYTVLLGATRPDEPVG